jgi:hypothetical protein
VTCAGRPGRSPGTFASPSLPLPRNGASAPLAAGLGGFALAAMLGLLGLLGLRIFEATGADIANLGEEHGHRVLPVCGKGPEGQAGGSADESLGTGPDHGGAGHPV